MDRIKKDTFFCGEITVFLSMILLLILALVGTSLESARICVGRSYADRGVQNAMDSLFTEYCNKLWEDYHLFFIEGEESKEQDKEYIKNQLYYYLKDTFDSEKNKKDMIKRMDLLDMEIGKIEVEDIIRAVDYEGELFLNEILEYSKYQVDEQFLSKGQNIVKSFEEVNAAIKVVEKQMEVEEKMSEVNREILEFISIVEGISVGKMGIEYKKNGTLKTETYFVKKFCPNEMTKTNIGIDNEIIWTSLKNSYINPISMLESLEAEARLIFHQVRALEEQMKAGPLNTSMIIPISDTRFYNIKNNFIKEATGILEKIKKAKKLLAHIKETQTICMNETVQLEKVYQQEENNLSETMKEAFSKELKELRIFSGLEENKKESSPISQILKMEHCLNEKENLIKESLKIGNIFVSGSSFEVANSIDKISIIKNQMRYYTIKEMKFDYSSFVIKKEVENPLKSFSNQYKNNLLNLVLENPDTISKKIKKSKMFEIENSEKEEIDYIKNLKKSATKGYTEGVGSDIQIFNRLYDAKEWMNHTKKEQFQKLLLTSYIEEHFKSYEIHQKEDMMQKKKQMVEKETVLSYEQEYILAGNLSDKENLSEIVTKIVFVRSMLNYIYLLTDLEKTKQAYETAVALVGYSCMAPLVQLTKNIILLIWALEEAMVDVAALLQGKEILIFKTKETFCISYEDLLHFDKSFIQTKARELSQQNIKMAMGYEEYLQLFLNFLSKEEKLYRVMDLIEENIKLRYDEKFQLENCIYGTKIKVDFYMDKKFISLPFVRKILDAKKEKFFIEDIQSYCY